MFSEDWRRPTADIPPMKLTIINTVVMKIPTLPVKIFVYFDLVVILLG